MQSFSELKKNLKADITGFKKIQVALLADSSSQLLNIALKATAVKSRVSLSVWEADYDTIDLTILDQHSGLYEHNPAFVLIFLSPKKMYRQFCNSEDKKEFAENQLKRYEQLFSTIFSKTGAKIICSNLAPYEDGVFGNFGTKTVYSFNYQQQHFNYMLMKMATTLDYLFINDLHTLQSRYGIQQTFDPKLYVTADMIYQLDFLPAIAENTMQVIDAVEGRFKKCLILDLDNTLWGGIIGDDGIDNIEIGSLGAGKIYSDIQLWAKQLKERGIILAVCSKNTEEIAKEPFEKHPDVILKLNDFALFVANWETKVDNIRYIQEVLNIGFDSMVFVDDNPFERNMVRQNIPDITVPELPEDPAEYLSFLTSLNLFETASFTTEDLKRNSQYQQEAKRTVSQKSFTSEDDFLASLQMECAVTPFESFSVPRVAQLSQRSNQFNLRTIRYADADIRLIMSDEKFITRSFSLKDIYGDYGLVSLLILEKKEDAGMPYLFIDTWIMSCRVLKRGLEELVLNEMVNIAGTNNINIIRGEYLPTAKNGLVKNLLSNLGFISADNGFWELNIINFAALKTFIKPI